MNKIGNLKKDIIKEELIKLEFSLGHEYKSNILLAEELIEKARIWICKSSSKRGKKIFTR